MIDEELRAAMRARREAAAAFHRDRRDGVPDLASVEERFAEAVGADRAPALWERIAELWREARAVPDPPGPMLTVYAPLLQAWAESHPEVDPGELSHIVHALLFEHR